MAHKRDYKPEDIAFPDQVITESELVSEMQTSYIDYAMSVIVGRALPDVRDGLKPALRKSAAFDSFTPPTAMSFTWLIGARIALR